jgi:hypothetical protein
LFFKL